MKIQQLGQAEPQVSALALGPMGMSLPAGMLPRLLLISDGNENLGSVVRAIWQAQQLGVPIDTIPLAGRPKPGLRLDSIAIPGQVFSGERFARPNGRNAARHR
jgi:hypothetical protein